MPNINFNNLPEAVEQLLLEVSDLRKLIVNQNAIAKPLIDPTERLTRKEVKLKYKVSYPTIHSLMKKGVLNYSKIGRKTLFKKEDLEKVFSTKSL